MQPIRNHSTAARAWEEQGRGALPLHPRQATSMGNAFQEIFEALMRLLPPASGLRRARGGGGGGGGDTSDTAVGGMHTAALRCGNQCREHIRSLQRGIEVYEGNDILGEKTCGCYGAIVIENRWFAVVLQRKCTNDGHRRNNVVEDSIQHSISRSGRAP